MKKRIILIISFLVLLTASLVLYSRYISTSGLIVKERKIAVENLASSYHGLKIVHFSDLHYGRTIKYKELENLVTEINKLKPDLVFFTGDLFDKDTPLSVEEYDQLTSQLNSINSNLGKYAIKGNHDLDTKWTDIITNGGFINLNDTYTLVYNNHNIPIVISGISSNLNSTLSINDKIKPIDEYINSIEKSYSILLIHEPDYIDNINISNYNLILAGHSHGGQVRLPIVGAVILPPGANKYYEEYYEINGSRLYISSGLGTSTINYRFMNKPSINFYRLMKKEAN